MIRATRIIARSSEPIPSEKFLDRIAGLPSAPCSALEGSNLCFEPVDVMLG